MNPTPTPTPSAGQVERIMAAADKYWEASPAARFRVREELLFVIRAALTSPPAPVAEPAANSTGALLHRLWLEGGGNADLKPGEVTEQNVADLMHGLNNLANDAIAAEAAAPVPAQPVEAETLTPARVWWNDMGAGAKLSFEPIPGAFEHCEYTPAAPPAPPVGVPVWIVFDEDGLPHHATIHPAMAHDHINDVLHHDFPEAAKWVVREYREVGK